MLGGFVLALVVDDEGDVRVLVAHLLAARKLKVAMAANADEARTLAILNEIDLLVTDIEMGGQPAGIELARELREAQPDLPVIYISGSDSWTGLVPGSMLLHKPFAARDLLCVLRRQGLGA